ncbi:protein Iojap, chloroplastic-like [Chenopodium quinoa]|uniref:protein Iojap, chloroplastic-like n=1 Tax=Chenopodium quinoa TaxID=63459 RepID=UPI000B795EED|nr:protein Iojap, chloroplastic-like [Chenopodium quinoa]
MLIIYGSSCFILNGGKYTVRSYVKFALMAHNLLNIFIPSSAINAGTLMSSPFPQLGFRGIRHFFNKCNQSMQTQNFKLSSMVSCRAIGSDINEDTDDMFDDLFEKHGKVVFRSKDQKTSGAEIDDDAESLTFAVAMAKVANEVKAADIKVLFVKPLVYWTRFFIIATAFSRPQIDAIRTKMADLAEEKFGKIPNGDLKPNSWTLLDFGDVVVHIFLPPQREFYNLEEFYGNAKSIELPFEDEKPFLR